MSATSKRTRPGERVPRQLRGVYAITDERLLAGRLLFAAEQALAGGARIMQYRNKSDTLAVRTQQASQLKALCDRFGALFLINDDIALCQAVGADGVHIGQNDMRAAEAREQLGSDAIIGVSCHSNVEYVRTAETAGADYIAVGRFFPSQTKPEAPLATIDDLRCIRQQTSLPIVAIGGITATNGSPLIAAGADMIAAINYLFAGDSVQHRTTQLAALFADATASTDAR